MADGEAETDADVARNSARHDFWRGNPVLDFNLHWRKSAEWYAAYCSAMVMHMTDSPTYECVTHPGQRIVEQLAREWGEKSPPWPEGWNVNHRSTAVRLVSTVLAGRDSVTHAVTECDPDTAVRITRYVLANSVAARSAVVNAALRIISWDTARDQLRCIVREMESP